MSNEPRGPLPPPNTRLHEKIGHLPPASQKKILAALRKVLPEHNEEALALQARQQQKAAK